MCVYLNLENWYFRKSKQVRSQVETKEVPWVLDACEIPDIFRVFLAMVLMFNFISRCEDFLLDASVLMRPLLMFKPEGSRERRGFLLGHLGPSKVGSDQGGGEDVPQVNGLNSECGGGDGERQRGVGRGGRGKMRKRKATAKLGALQRCFINFVFYPKQESS